MIFFYINKHVVERKTINIVIIKNYVLENIVGNIIKNHANWKIKYIVSVNTHYLYTLLYTISAKHQTKPIT